jgi:hypothetical protein
VVCFRDIIVKILRKGDNDDDDDDDNCYEITAV